jgi:hypothetical protein
LIGVVQLPIIPGVKVTIARWVIDYDRDQTRLGYDPVTAGLGCDCATCRNFLSVGQQVFSLEAHKLFEALGVDYRKPAEVFHNARLADGLHHYAGWFHFIGNIESGADVLEIDTTGRTGIFRHEPFGNNFEIGCSSRIGLLPESFAGKPVVQLEFTTKIPWVLAEDEPSS